MTDLLQWRDMKKYKLPEEIYDWLPDDQQGVYTYSGKRKHGKN